MAVVTTLGKKINILSLSYAADGDLTDLQYCAVMASGAATGKTKLKAPTGQGVICLGILQTYQATDTKEAEILVEGVSNAIADSTFNSGVELCASGADGKLETAASGDYVIAIAEEAATEADQHISVRVVSPYQKN